MSQTAAAPFRVFIVDDHEIVRRGVRELLDGEPDIAVLDVQLPDGTGVEVSRDVRSTLPELRCLMLTSFDDDDALLRAVAAGASGYVLKQVRSSDIVTAVRRVAAGESLLTQDLVDRAAERIQRGPVADDRIASLTPQERRILDLLAGGMTNRRIANELILSEKTVKNYVSNLLSKMGMGRRTEAAVYAARLQAGAGRPVTD